MKIEAQLIGADKIERALAKMTKGEAKKLMRQSLRDGAKIVKKSVQDKIHSVSGFAKKNVKVKSMGVKKGTMRMTVGTSAAWYTGSDFYMSFVEFGHKQGNRKLGSSRKTIDGKAPFKKGYESVKQQALDAVMNNLKQELYGGLMGWIKWRI